MLIQTFLIFIEKLIPQSENQNNDNNEYLLIVYYVPPILGC